MVMEKEIYHHNQKIGMAKISMQGLYYRFECRCLFPEPGIYRLYAICNDENACLGICVPVGDAFGITTKIPVSRLGTGDISVVADSKTKQRVLSVDQNSPFENIEQLDNAVFCEEGIRIIERSPGRPGSGQIREHQRI